MRLLGENLVRLVWSLQHLKNRNVCRLLRLLDSAELEFDKEKYPHLTEYDKKQFDYYMSWSYGIHRVVYVYKALMPHFTPEMMSQGLMLIVDVLQLDDKKFGTLSEVPAEFDCLKRDGWVYGTGDECVYMDKNPEKFFGKALWKFLLDHYKVSPKKEYVCEVAYDVEDMVIPTTHYILTSQCPTCKAYMGYNSSTCRACVATQHAEDLLKTPETIQKSKKKKRKSHAVTPFEIRADAATLHALGFVF